MNINTDIVEEFLKEKSLKKMENHWIFNSIIEGRHMFKEPPISDYLKIKNLYEILIASLKDFKPINLDLWEKIFGKFSGFPEDVIIYLVVGSPSPYEAMVREDNMNNKCIIFDLDLISSYSDNANEVKEIIRGFITHELAHVYIEKTYSQPKSNASFYDKLCYMVFNEGLAHFLSFKEDVMKVNWYSEEKEEKRRKAYDTFLYAVRQDHENEDEVLIKADSGSFWDKFGAIAGLFAVVDYLKDFNNDENSLIRLYKEGPKAFANTILKRNMEW